MRLGSSEQWPPWPPPPPPPPPPTGSGLPVGAEATGAGWQTGFRHRPYGEFQSCRNLPFWSQSALSPRCLLVGTTHTLSHMGHGESHLAKILTLVIWLGLHMFWLGFEFNEIVWDQLNWVLVWINIKSYNGYPIWCNCLKLKPMISFSERERTSFIQSCLLVREWKPSPGGNEFPIKKVPFCKYF